MADPSATVVIRPGRPADEAALGRLGALLVELHHSFDERRFIAAPPDVARGYGGFLASQIRKKDKLVIVAELDGVVVGYAFAGVEGPDWMMLRGPAGALYDILVDPAARKHGVGRQLLDAVLKEFDARGVTQVVLSTATQNEEAQQLFARAGFRKTMVEMTRG